MDLLVYKCPIFPFLVFVRSQQGKIVWRELGLFEDSGKYSLLCRLYWAQSTADIILSIAQCLFPFLFVAAELPFYDSLCFLLQNTLSVLSAEGYW